MATDIAWSLPIIHAVQPSQQNSILSIPERDRCPCLWKIWSIYVPSEISPCLLRRYEIDGMSWWICCSAITAKLHNRNQLLQVFSNNVGQDRNCEWWWPSYDFVYLNTKCHSNNTLGDRHRNVPYCNFKCKFGSDNKADV